jgi:hypothetical protein
MARSGSRILAGLILLVAGAAGFVYGLITYNNQRGALGSTIERIVNGSSVGERNATIFMIAGGAVALIGLLTLAFGSRRR